MTQPGRLVEVVAWDAAWPGLFAALATVLARGLDGLDARIEHVGSTSVPGLCAKPIVDIDVVIEAARFASAAERLRRLGYQHQGDLGLAGREAFKREGDDVPRDADTRRWPAHHLYVCAPDARELRRHLLFRDWLRAHPDDAAAYGRLKQRLAQAFADDRDAYTDGKSAFVEDVLARAVKK